MQDETRVAVISMIIDNEESAASINALLHDCREYIIGRMGKGSEYNQRCP